ncbi:hypothetical protein FF100_18780 [Methylobacterium terricola]|uniref:Nucleotide modification associated domain-containing protein n=1 Tax=Methylobacterium terricola TaxID=2583531 RepID=A0A5C4LDR9_9HYPH|nr:hypothetical protein [Methylobacterium terricola]TNC11684.1 hypothetical protein FF100_18780 [Methylobacterium terricola]
MARVYVYVVKYDFGFAPNPFQGTCTLACCMPIIRRVAQVGDWIVGMGGRDLKATGRCIYAMQVSSAMKFDEYWSHEDYIRKRPKRNGSRVAMVGDNIYRHAPGGGGWLQENSIHSMPDGSQDLLNTTHDVSVDRVLISTNFIYFGSLAPTVPQDVIASIGYRNGRGHRVYSAERSSTFLNWIVEQANGEMNRVVGDPFQLRQSDRRFSREKNRLL